MLRSTAFRLLSKRAFHSTPLVAAEHVVKVPSMGDSISEGTVVEIKKQVGEAVQVDEVVMVLETDKVSVDVMSPMAGTLVKTLASLDEDVQVGKDLFVVDGDVAATVVSTPAPAAAAPAAPTPAVQAPAAPAAAASHHHRVPRIKFLGKRSLLPASHHAPAASAAPAAASYVLPPSSSASVLSFTDIPARFARKPLSQADIEAINTGRAFA
ncbi:Aste57867_2807 [Aphanomyces stellatus]|uniref:Aste57867_2807 protein n=1 Tax=Aphanomyces stellatus TaxID=120398 RepID=A0A485K9E9_9STRA|nr:hypothetical protein As57867_002800 [Aphanomyces stellatus]VFT79996.1 Aste57867_2807 [Aphanomyces stellatus]